MAPISVSVWMAIQSTAKHRPIHYTQGVEQKVCCVLYCLLCVMCSTFLGVVLCVYMKGLCVVYFVLCIVSHVLCVVLCVVCCVFCVMCSAFSMCMCVLCVMFMMYQLQIHLNLYCEIPYIHCVHIQSL